MHRPSPPFGIGAFVLAFALGLGLARTAEATVAVSLPLPDLTARSSDVVHGVVVATKSAWEGGQIYTTTHVDVLETVKGEQRHRTIWVKQLGGQVGNLAMRISGQAAFEVGEEVVLFVKPGPVAREVVGMAQGKWLVKVDPGSKAKVVGRDLRGLVLASKDRSGRMITMLPRLDQARRLQEFLDEIRSLVAEQARTGGAR